MILRAWCRRRRAVAACLAVVLAAGPGAALSSVAREAAAQEAAAPSGRASISGELFQGDGHTPLEGARAYAINVKTGQRYVSEVTGRGGNYDIKGLPAGTYDIAVEVNGEIFVADNLVDLGSGEGVSLSYAVEPRRPANRILKGLPQPAGSASVMGVFKASATAAPSFWKSPGGITLLSILGAGAVWLALDDDDEDASPSTP
jgi:hypothetical protein